MTRTTLDDRRNAGTGRRLYRLDGRRLLWTTPKGEPVGEMALAEVRQVRLTVEMAGQESQVVCRITTQAGGEVAIGSMRWAGVGLWEANARDFRAFLEELHRDLADQPGPVRYIEGSSVTFLAIMTGLGGLMALIGGGFFAKLFLLDQNGVGLFFIPVLAIGLWLMRLFWPRAPQAYDPARYSQAPENESHAGEGESDPALAEKEGSVTNR